MSPDTATKDARAQDGTESPPLLANCSALEQGRKEDGDKADSRSLSDDSAKWAAVFEVVVPNVVRIHLARPYPFDGSRSNVSQATGFVIDAERGYILTNRHVTTTSPLWGYAAFESERVDIKVVFIDPVHDFAIVKYDPTQLKFSTPTGLKLFPEGAIEGAEVRLVGNDGGDKMSFLAGSISLVDRNAPIYGPPFNDSNTFYIQVALGSSGGSSGSPVLDINGNVIAINCGGRSDNAKTSWLLPLSRPLRAYRRIVKGLPVTRGSIQTKWTHNTFDACSERGLPKAVEEKLRAMECDVKLTGLLVVSNVLPKGPADGKLKVGDILLKVNGQVVAHFLPLDICMDNNVGNTVELTVWRNESLLKVDVLVQDLQEVSPKRFVTVASGYFQDLSLQLAQFQHRPACTGGVYVASAAACWPSSLNNHLIVSVDDQPINNLDDFVEVMKKTADKSRLVLKHYSEYDCNVLRTTVIDLDRQWNPDMVMFEWDDGRADWVSTTIGKPIPPSVPEPISIKFKEMEKPPSKEIGDLVRSFVTVGCRTAHTIESAFSHEKFGRGLVLDAELGFVYVSTSVIRHSVSAIKVNIAESAIVHARLRFSHPTLGFSIIQYDPKHINANIKAVTVSPDPPSQGEKLTFFGYTGPATPMSTDVTVIAIEQNYPGSFLHRPMCKPVNIESFTTNPPVSIQSSYGVFVDDKGHAKGILHNVLQRINKDGELSGAEDFSWNTRSVDLSRVGAVLADLRQGVTPQERFLPVLLERRVPHVAVALGMSPEWVTRVAEESPFQQNLFLVTFPYAGFDCELEQGDLILTANGKLVTRLSDLSCQFRSESIKMRIIRAREELELDVKTVTYPGTTRLVEFVGAVFHTPHLGARQVTRGAGSGVFVSTVNHGSPAQMYGLGPAQIVTALDGHPTPDLDTFIKVAKAIPDKVFFNVESVDLGSEFKSVTAVRKCDKYYPMVEHVFNGFSSDDVFEKGWARIEHQSPPPLPLAPASASGATQLEEGVTSKEDEATTGHDEFADLVQVVNMHAFDEEDDA